MSSCQRCGFSKKNDAQPGVSSLMKGTRCSHCWNRNFLFSNTRCLWNFQGLPREWIHKLKYHDGEYLVADLGKILTSNFEWREYLSSAILVPVPLHWRRYWQRDYNQSNLIARAMAKVSGSPVISLLSRCKFSPSQTELRGHERLRNVQNAFSLNRKAKNIDRNYRIILVDDVMTTGATLQACATVLRENGFEHIDVATLARG
jgi:ComF family protein